jgi:kynurenine 3-monooxygenase
MSSDLSSFHVVVLGGGLVGALAAVQFANKGYKVQLFEKRTDIRTQDQSNGRSINLALSRRGIAALENANVADQILSSVIPMKGRCIHLESGSLSTQPYGLQGESINSVDRKKINEILLTAAEASNVELNFEWGLEQIDFEKNIVMVGNGKETRLIKDADLIIGADGVFSRTRQQMMRRVRMDFEQKYIDHGYCELTMPPSDSGDYQLCPNHLHIWPRKTFMMIALPNVDKSFTLTLFMPWDDFNAIKTPTDLLCFFKTHFPDTISMIGEDGLVRDYFKNEKGSLMSIKVMIVD